MPSIAVLVAPIAAEVHEAYTAPAGVNAPPITYEANGRQYVAVAIGGNALFGFPQGDLVMAFALPQ